MKVKNQFLYQPLKSTHGQTERYMTISNLKTDYQPIMVDCETIGLQPNKNAVMQIAAVAFDPVTFAPQEEITIYLPLVEQIKSGRVADPKTVEWWGNQNAKVLQDIMDEVAKCGSVADELQKLTDWVTEKCRRGKTFAKATFWAKPVAFDFPFVDGLYQDAKVTPVFSYREVMDMHTHIVTMFQSIFYHTYNYPLPRGAAVDMYWWFNDYMKELDENVKDSAHNATADCYYQLQWLKLAHELCMPLLSHFDEKGTVKDFKPK